MGKSQTYKDVTLPGTVWLGILQGVSTRRKESLRVILEAHNHTRSFSSVQFSSVTRSCPTLCDPMNRSTPGLPIHHHLPEFTQTHVHRVCDAIQPSHPWSVSKIISRLCFRLATIVVPCTIGYSPVVHESIGLKLSERMEQWILIT